MDKRVTVGGKQLETIIYGWLRALPKSTWGKDPEYERLRAQKRHDPDAEPDPRRDVAAAIAAKLDELGWTVSYPEPGNLFGDQARSRPSDD